MVDGRSRDAARPRAAGPRAAQEVRGARRLRRAHPAFSGRARRARRRPGRAGAGGRRAPPHRLAARARARRGRGILIGRRRGDWLARTRSARRRRPPWSRRGEGADLPRCSPASCRPPSSELGPKRRRDHQRAQRMCDCKARPMPPRCARPRRRRPGPVEEGAARLRGTRAKEAQDPNPCAPRPLPAWPATRVDCRSTIARAGRGASRRRPRGRRSLGRARATVERSDMASLLCLTTTDADADRRPPSSGLDFVQRKARGAETLRRRVRARRGQAPPQVRDALRGRSV